MTEPESSNAATLKSFYFTSEFFAAWADEFKLGSLTIEERESARGAHVQKFTGTALSAFARRKKVHHEIKRRGLEPPMNADSRR